MQPHSHVYNIVTTDDAVTHLEIEDSIKKQAVHLKASISKR